MSRPVVYCLLNSYLFIIGCFSTLFTNSSNQGISQVIGSDACNIFYVFGMIILNEYHKLEQDFNKWELFRDSLWYIIGLIILCVLYLKQTWGWWAGIIMIVYYLAYYLILLNNDEIKDNVLKLLFIIKEDDEFNSDQHFNFKRRRTSITVCNLQGCIPDETDEVFSLKNNRINALLKLKYTGEPKMFKVYYDFQRVVYKVIYALRNHTKLEKIRRAEYITNL